MKKICTEATGVVRIHEVDKPVLKKGYALMKMLYGGICGTDLNIYRGLFAYGCYPKVPGHEIAAEVVEVEENTYGISPGMIATVNPYFNCGKCYSCQRGLVNCCMQNETLGSQRDGVYGEYFTIPIERVYEGRGLDAKSLALIEPFAVAYHGIKRAKPKRGEKVLVIGGGTIGIFAMISALYFGADVYVADVSENKLKIAKKLGATGVVHNTSKETLAQSTNKFTDGNGFDITVEAVGLAQTFESSVESAAFGGRVILIGISKQRLDFDFTMIQKKELSIYGSRNAVKEDFDELIEIVNKGGVSLDGIVSNVFPYEQAQDAFSAMDVKGDDNLKILLQF